MFNVETINEKLEGDNLELVKEHINKTNDESYDGYVIKSKDEGEQVALIMREEMFDEFDDIDEVIDFIRSATIDADEQKQFLNSMKWLEDTEKIYSRVRPQIFPAENIERFKECDIYVERINDFGLSYFVTVDEIKDSVAIIQLNNELIDMAGIDRTKLRENAFKNLEKLSIVYDTNEELVKNGLTKEDEDRIKMYTVTTKDQFRGAPAIFLPDVIEQIKEKIGEEFIIIPSSVDEMLCIRKPDKLSQDFFASMIKEGNKKFNDEEEILSDYVYQYKDGKILKL